MQKGKENIPKKGIRRYPSRDDGTRTHDLGFLTAVLYPLSYIVYILPRFIDIVNLLYLKK